MNRPAPPSSPKKPPQKKRHTKPCRYFQTGSCPHAAQEDCDFAHVYSDQPSPGPAPKQCRYYLQGICTNGIWCQYKHGEDSPGENPLLENSHTLNSLLGREIGVGSNTLQQRVETVPPVVYVPSHFNGMYPAPTPWSPYADGFHSPLEFAPPPHLLHRNPKLSPAASLDSVECVTPSSSPTSSVSDGDGVLFPDEAGPQYSYFNPEHHVQYVASPYVDDTSMAPFSPAQQLSVMPATYGMAPLYDIFSPKASPSAGFYAATFAPQPQSPRTPINRAKLVSYRTKPCRYFKPGTICPNGQACTFIHAAPEQSPEPSSPDPAKLEHELPSKPSSTKEENTRKGYFPISWRVIGGGVLLSGAKAHPSLPYDDDLSDLSEDSFDGRADPVSRVLGIDIPASAPPSAVRFPSSDSNADTDDSRTPTGLTSRPRALSIPSTPITTHVDILRLFSAESPGGL
ncbi:hypothetical protein C8R43DRAFT_567320 [Mycena crocata]|nr:hypothetical protein C8R43DRAFT_567320 [Mycena crocata]